MRQRGHKYVLLFALSLSINVGHPSHIAENTGVTHYCVGERGLQWYCGNLKVFQHLFPKIGTYKQGLTCRGCTGTWEETDGWNFKIITDNFLCVFQTPIFLNLAHAFYLRFLQLLLRLCHLCWCLVRLNDVDTLKESRISTSSTSYCTASHWNLDLTNNFHQDLNLQW